jgi:hypothetical protein
VASEKREREFSQRMAEFASNWNALVKQTGQGTWNAKQAEKTRKAFEKLIHSEGWLENKKEADLSAATTAE